MLLLIVPLLLAVQGTTIALVYRTTLAHITEQSREALLATSANFEHWMNQTVARLADSSRILAADFGFRRAIGSRDIATIRSALENAGRRINADETMLIGLVGDILVDASRPDSELAPFPDAALLEQARREGEAAGLIPMNGRVMQFVVVPVRAPDVIGWVGVGMTVGDAEAERLKAQSTIPVEVTFALSRDGVRFSPAATTLPPGRAAELAAAMTGIAAAGQRSHGPIAELEIAGETYATSFELLDDARGEARVAAAIQYPLSAALAPHRPLFTTLGALALAGFLVAALAAGILARSMTRPLRALDRAARRIQSGDYEDVVEVDGPEELHRLAGAFNAMAGSIAERERELEYRAGHDVTTGVPNRAVLERHLDGIADPDLSRVLFAVHLENLAEIDNTLGHSLGDELLRNAAQRLADTLVRDETLYHTARDKFVIASPDAGAGALDLIAGRIHLAFDAPFMVSAVNIDVHVKVGAALRPEHGREARPLLRCLEVAVEHAGQDLEAFSLYNPDVDRYSAERLAIMSDLRDGLAENQLELHYQPKIELASGRIRQAEALMRWNHPRRGRVAPDEFIDLAERTGYIRWLTRWALTRAIEDCSAWRAAGYDTVVGVNVSARDLLDTALPRFLLDELERCGLSTEALVLEITESAVMQRPEQAMSVLRTLAAMGLGIAIDDFGTGQSSMTYVKRLPATEIKIDKSFVLDLTNQAADQKIVRAVISLGADFGMKVTAEGVENAATAQFLAQAGCHYGQGWHFARAMPAGAFTALLQQSEVRDDASATASISRIGT